MSSRWSLEQVLALAPARVVAARPLAVAASWTDTGSDDRALWGRHVAARAEPYDVMVDHTPSVGALAARCSCPSRVSPCKHAIALLLLWAHGDVAPSARPTTVEHWVGARDARVARVVARVDGVARVGAQRAGDASSPSLDSEGATVSRDAVDEALPPRPSVSDERLRRIEAGLLELERWIDDRVRVGLGDPSIARYATWDDLASRLVDAQAGGLANRVRRLAGQVGAGADWHAHVLAELGVLSLLARAGRHLRELDEPWREGVAAALGLTVRQAEVRAQVPETWTWAVLGCSDVVEDRIVVRRTWLHALHDDQSHDRRRDPHDGAHQGWAMLLSFAAHGAALESPLDVGTVVTADLHRYPGTVALRALLGPVHHQHPDRTPSSSAVAAAPTIAEARRRVGSMLALEPWLERVPVCLTAAPTLVGGSWVLGDHTGVLPLVGACDIATLLAASGGRSVTITAEWTPLGLLPLSLHLADRLVVVDGRRREAA
jgi:hypothetical protein